MQSQPSDRDLIKAGESIDQGWIEARAWWADASDRQKAVVGLFINGSMDYTGSSMSIMARMANLTWLKLAYDEFKNKKTTCN